MVNKLYTIGFTQKTLEEFIDLLKTAGVATVVDVRLNNTSQLAGFAKRDDLAYLLRRGFGIEYVHALELAPTQAMLVDYRKYKDWGRYSRDYSKLLDSRSIVQLLTQLQDRGPLCLLCAEDMPEHCHRRLAAEYIASHLPDIEIIHLR